MAPRYNHHPSLEALCASFGSIGATHVVLPYRVSVDEIADIKKMTGIGIEVILFKTPSGGKICPGKCMMQLAIASGWTTPARIISTAAPAVAATACEVRVTGG